MLSINSNKWRNVDTNSVSAFTQARVSQCGNTFLVFPVTGGYDIGYARRYLNHSYFELLKSLRIRPTKIGNDKAYNVIVYDFETETRYKAICLYSVDSVKRELNDAVWKSRLILNGSLKTIVEECTRSTTGAPLYLKASKGGIHHEIFSVDRNNVHRLQRVLTVDENAKTCNILNINTGITRSAEFTNTEFRKLKEFIESRVQI